MSCYVNLLLAFFWQNSLNWKKEKIEVLLFQDPTHCMALFVFVIVYHIFAEFTSKTKYWKDLTQQNKQGLDGNQVEET